MSGLYSKIDQAQRAAREGDTKEAVRLLSLISLELKTDCTHRLIDNRTVRSGYACVDCGEHFQALDHDPATANLAFLGSNLMNAASAQGMVVSITQEPLQPLRMSNYTSVLRITPKFVREKS